MSVTELSPHQPAPPPGRRQLLTPAQTAQYIGISQQTLAKWRSQGTYKLPYVKVGRVVRYQLSDLLVWLETRRRGQGE